jgi:DUF2975 family protein
MTTPSNKKLEDIKRVSGQLRLLFILIAAGTVFGTFAKLFMPHASVTLAGVQFTGEAVTGAVWMLWIAANVLTAAVLLKLFFHLIRLFGLYAQAQIFTQQNVAQIRQIGVSLLLLPVVWLLACGFAVSQLDPSTSFWTLLLGSFPFGGLIGGGAILPIAWIMDAGRKLREAQDLVI